MNEKVTTGANAEENLMSVQASTLALPSTANFSSVEIRDFNDAGGTVQLHYDGAVYYYDRFDANKAYFVRTITDEDGVYSNVIIVDENKNVMFDGAVHNIKAIDGRVDKLEEDVFSESSLNGDYYRVDVPADTQVAKIREIGGRTYKSENLFNLQDFCDKEYAPIYKCVNGELIISQEDGTAWASKPKYNYIGGTYFVYADCEVDIRVNGNKIFQNSQSALNGKFTLNTDSALQLKAFTFDAIYPSTAHICISKYDTGGFTPWFPGLRDTPVTEVRSEGANILNAESFVPGSNIENLVITQDEVSFSMVRGRNTARATCRLFLEKGSYYVNGEVTQSDGRQGGYGVYDDETSEFVINQSSEGFSVNTFEIAVSKEYTFNLYCNYNSNDATKVVYKNVLVKRGVTPAPYTPYLGTISTIPIPKEVQEVDGYGMGIDNITNTVSIKAGEFTAKVKKQIAKASDVFKTNKYSNVIYFGFNMNNDSVDYGKYTTNYICDRFNIKEYYDFNTVDSIGSIRCTGNGTAYWVGFAPGTTLEQAKAAIDGTEIVYVLKEPVKANIAQYFPNGADLPVQGNGSVIFENEHKSPAPVKFDFYSKRKPIEILNETGDRIDATMSQNAISLLYSMLDADKLGVYRYVCNTSKIEQSDAVELISNSGNIEGNIIEFLTNGDNPNKIFAYGFLMTSAEGDQYIFTFDFNGKISEWTKATHRETDVHKANEDFRALGLSVSPEGAMCVTYEVPGTV